MASVPLSVNVRARREYLDLGDDVATCVVEAVVIVHWLTDREARIVSWFPLGIQDPGRGCEDKTLVTDSDAQSRRILTTPTWSGLVGKGRPYSPFTINVEHLVPWRTLTEPWVGLQRQHFRRPA